MTTADEIKLYRELLARWLDCNQKRLAMHARGEELDDISHTMHYVEQATRKALRRGKAKKDETEEANDE